MWNNAKSIKKQRLSQEILGLFGATALIAVFCYGFLQTVSNSLVLNYAESQQIEFTEYQWTDIEFGLQGISFISSVILFVVLFLFLVGDRISYISEIVKGIEALGRHDWKYEIPLQGDNELTELAKCVNVLSKEEQMLREKEKGLQEEKEALIRSLSHDIRTPLTAILSYSEYMKNKDCLSQDEIKDYMELMGQKAQQIKILTDRLLDGGLRQLEQIENGHFLMEQLVDEWEAGLEEEYECQIDMSACPQFAGEVDVQELRRIFDNLASNIRKYAEKSEPVTLCVKEQDGRVCIFQSNRCKRLDAPLDSTKIGIDNVRKIAAFYGGSVEVIQKESEFSIVVTLIEIKDNL